VSDAVEDAGREEGGLVVGETGRPEELGFDPAGDGVFGKSRFQGQVFEGEDALINFIPIRS
jgi:hypothetical protein